MESSPEFDVVVAGSGAAGMTAALAAVSKGLSVVVIEKTGYFGGSTARSGGGGWVPGHAGPARAGVRDSKEQASQYLAHVAGDEVELVRQQAFIEHGPAMLDLVRAMCPFD